MSLADIINEQNTLAIKNKDEDAKGIFSILKNKIMLAKIEKRAKGEELTDADVVAIIQKTVKELDEEKINFEKANRQDKVNSLEKQKSLLTVFLPKQMSEEEIKQIILSLEDKSVGAVMKHFRENYSGKCDMSKVSSIARQI